MLSPLLRAQDVPVIVPCAEDKKMQIAQGLVDKMAVRKAEGFEAWLAPEVSSEQRERMRQELQRSSSTVSTLLQKHRLSVVRVYPSAEETIFRCRFIGDTQERFRMDVSFHTTDCRARIIALRIDREPPPDPDASEEPPPPPPPPAFRIQP